ncbi:Chitinase [uncultured Candidatus Thioglobus sp.]|nr:Chitinase [uncultured Candidatus Thioglobus sp.]
MQNMLGDADAFNQNLGRWYVKDTTDDDPVTTTPALIAQNDVLDRQPPIYELVDGDGDTDNILFTLTNTGAPNIGVPNTGVLSLKEADPTTKTYSLRIGIRGEGDLGRDRFGTDNEVAIRLEAVESEDGTIIGYAIVVPLNLGLTAEAVAAAETQILNAILPQLLRATAKITVDNISNRIDQAFSSSPADTDASLNLGGSSSLQELINNNARTTLQDGLNIKQMFNNSSFLIPLNVAGDNNYGINNITLWGSGDYLSLEDDVSAVDWEGEVIGGSVGIDARLNQNLIAGAALSYSEGDVDYKRDGGEYNSEGTLTNTLYSIHPYIAYDLSQGRVWGALGYGQGEVEINDKATDSANRNQKQPRHRAIQSSLWG